MGDLFWAAVATGAFGVLSLYTQYALNKKQERKLKAEVESRVGTPSEPGVTLTDLVEKLVGEKEARLIWQEKTTEKLMEHEHRLVRVENPWMT